MTPDAPWYRDERFLIPLAILLAGLALIALKQVSRQPQVAQTVAATLAAPPAPPPQVQPHPGPRPPRPAPGYTDCTGIWSGRYEQVGDSGDFSEFRLVQEGRRLTGDGATRSRALNDTAHYTIEGTIDGFTVRFTDRLTERKFLWCDGCTYTGTVNESYTRIELRATCPGLCPGGTMVLERLPPDRPPVLL